MSELAPKNASFFRSAGCTRVMVSGRIELLYPGRFAMHTTAQSTSEGITP